jgi:hypothetical protein
MGESHIFMSSFTTNFTDQSMLNHLILLDELLLYDNDAFMCCLLYGIFAFSYHIAD